MLNNTHLMVIWINYVGDTDQQLQCRILMTNIADDTPSISSFHELVNSFMTEAVII